MGTLKKIAEHESQGHTVSYSERYDAFCCENCDEWLEKPCSADPSDPHGCYHECASRPEKPSLVKDEPEGATTSDV